MAKSSMKKPSGHKPGGGVFSSKRKEVSVKAGPPSTNKMSPAGANQLGNHLGNPQGLKPLKEGTMPQVPLGNAAALRVGAGKPGADRTLYGKSGMQAQHGPNGGPTRPEGRDIFADFPGKGN